MAETAKDFSGQNLRGRSFKGQDLRGAKFIGADIRGADFTGANLTGADFTRARAGLRRSAALSYLGLAFIMATISSLMNMMVVSGFGVSGKTEDRLQLSVVLVVVMVFYVISYRSGLEAGLRFGLISFAFTFAVVVVAVAVAAVAGAGAFAVPVAVAGAVAVAGTEKWIIGSICAGLCTFVNVLLAWRAQRGDENQAFIIKTGLALARWGGTRFRHANLTETNFSGATLQTADLRDAQLIRTRWNGAKKLLLARRNGTILEDYTVRAFLESGTLPNKSLAGKNLKGVCLAGYDLSSVAFTEADLSEADLRGAKLANANLTKVHAIGTLLQGADLSGACIEDWNIDHTTQLEGVHCRYVYMLNGQRERQPSHGEFQEGQFSALFEKVFDTVNLIFTQKGIDWQAFTQVFGQMQVAYGEHGTELAVQAIERKSDGTFIVKVKVPPETDKAVIQQEFFREYENKLALQDAKYQAQLQAKNEVIAELRERYTDMKLIANTLARNQSINIEQNLGVIEISGRKIEISDKVSGSNLNVGDLSGEVTTSIGTAPATSSVMPARSAIRPVKILFFAANPQDTDRLRLDEEIHEIDHALRQAKFRDKFDLVQYWAVRVTELQGLLLRHDPDIVHFSGHGSPTGEIVLEDSVEGYSQSISLRALSDLFEVLRDNIRCVVLNACYTKAQAEEIAKHIACVVGMSKAIGDSAAIRFASAFYQALGYGRNIRTAFALGCGQVDLTGLNEQDTPQLLVTNKQSEEIVFVKEIESESEASAA